MQRTASLIVLFLATLLACACTNSRSSTTAERGASVVGTVVDAATGKPVEGARVEGPGGKKTRTDERGRFELKGLEAGTTGEVEADAGDGRTAKVTLRRLPDRALEIVLHVRRP